MLYSTNSKEFKQIIMATPFPNCSFDYPFFAAKLLDALMHKGRIHIIPFESLKDAFTKLILDADYQKTNSGEIINLIFEGNRQFTFYLDRKSITQTVSSEFNLKDATSGKNFKFIFFR